MIRARRDEQPDVRECFKRLKKSDPTYASTMQVKPDDRIETQSFQMLDCDVEVFEISNI